MQVTEKRINIESNWFSAERDVQRTKGLHLSSIIDFIEAQEGVKRDRDPNGGMSAVGNAFAAGGFLWERVLTNLIERSPYELWDWMFGRALAEISNPKVIRPGEQCLDGGPCPKCDGKGYCGAGKGGGVCKSCAGTGRILIYMTPDGLNLEDHFLEEWKDTSKSARNPITDKKFRRWVSFQVPAYLKAMRVLVCRLRVRFNHGDYTDNAPVWKEFILTFSQQEIDETWDCICLNARIMVEQGLA